MWKIEGREMHVGGCIYEGNQFRLKNIKNNMYLMVKLREEIYLEQDKKFQADSKKESKGK